MKFIGVDLGWQGKPTGLAVLHDRGDGLELIATGRQSGDAILEWIDSHTANADAMVAIDAPLIITRKTGSRPVDREMSRRFWKEHAGCHSANLGRPFATFTTGFAQALQDRGFAHAAAIEPRTPGRYQIEVHPHAATVNLFDLDRILKYKKGAIADRASGLRRFRSLLLERLPRLVPAVRIETLPDVPVRGGSELKAAEDMLDAVMAAYVGAHWWFWGTERNQVFGSAADGYIVVPDCQQH